MLEEEQRIVGFLPYHQGRFGVGRALGYGVANQQGLVHTPGFGWDAADLLTRSGLAVYEFDVLLADQSERWAPRRAAAEPAPYIDLSPGWEEWLRRKRATGQAIKAIQRKHRKLAREAGDVAFDFGARQQDSLSLLMQWKSQQYRRTGRFDRFARPWFVAAFVELAEMATADFCGVRSVLSVGGRPVAIQQALCANGVLSYWFPAYDVAFASYSPGRICMLEHVREASQRGLGRIDLGKGFSDHKEIFKDGAHAVAEGWAEVRSPVAALRRLQQAPRRRTLDFVLARPRLRRVARELLNDVGRVQTVLRGR